MRLSETSETDLLRNPNGDSQNVELTESNGVASTLQSLTQQNETQISGSPHLPHSPQSPHQFVQLGTHAPSAEDLESGWSMAQPSSTDDFGSGLHLYNNTPRQRMMRFWGIEGTSVWDVLGHRLIRPAVICGTIIVFMFIIYRAISGSSAVPDTSDYPPWMDPINNVNASLKRLNMKDLFSGKYRTKSVDNVQWVNNGTGILTSIMPKLVSMNIATKQVYEWADLSQHGLEVESVQFSPDEQFALLQYGSKRKWRRSSESNYSVVHFQSNRVSPLTVDPKLSTISLMQWSPQGTYITAVAGNNLFISRDNGKTFKAITSTGDDNHFNGISDWIYEEEVLEASKAFWWSPQASRLAYLVLDETDVDTYKYPLYAFDRTDYHLPVEMPLRYPKTGTKNPVTDIMVYDVQSGTTITLDSTDLKSKEYIVYDVQWQDEITVLVKVMDRAQSMMQLRAFDTRSGKSVTVREEVRENGWLENYNSLLVNQKNPSQIIDVAPATLNGFPHILLLDKTLRAPIWATSGNWEVTEVLHVDWQASRVYFMATKDGSTERHLYSTDLSASTEIKKLTPSIPGFYSVNFAPGKSGNYLLSYNGPKVPTETIRNIFDESISVNLNDNEKLAEKLLQYALPTTKYVEIDTYDKKYKMNAMLLLPPEWQQDETWIAAGDMDPKRRRKFGVLMWAYGGPNSQQVQKRFKLDYLALLASSDNPLVVMITDGRGTGALGTNFRMEVTRNLGTKEVDDQIAARNWIAEQEYVLPEKIGISGWSFGGYLAARVIENAPFFLQNSSAPPLFKAGISIAPVTDWMLYDTVYTERYMKLADANTGGYASTAVTQTAGFEDLNRNNGEFLLLHGTADDNVHLQHALRLVRLLTMSGVSNFRSQFYTDSTHSMSKDNAYASMYKLINLFILRLLGGGANNIGT